MLPALCTVSTARTAPRTFSGSGSRATSTSIVVRGMPCTTLAYPPMRRYRARARFNARKTSGTEGTLHLPEEVVRLQGQLEPFRRRETGEPREQVRFVGHEKGPSLRTRGGAGDHQATRLADACPWSTLAHRLTFFRCDGGTVWFRRLALASARARLWALGDSLRSRVRSRRRKCRRPTGRPSLSVNPNRGPPKG